MFITVNKKLMSVLIIVLGIIISIYFVSSKPKPKRSAPKPISLLVETLEAKLGKVDLILEGLGTVTAAQEVILRSRVMGTILEISEHFEPGKRFKKDDLLIQIDPDDYINEVKRKENLWAKARADYDLEMGQQEVARTELKLLAEILPDMPQKQKMALALRAPQLIQAKATLALARVDLKQAELNLQRTKIKAPFNGMVLEREVSIGSQASLSDNLGTIVGTDEYWIEASFPLDKLHGMGITEIVGLEAKVISGTGYAYQGEVKSLVANLDSLTRMGRVFISVFNPLEQKDSASPRPPLILGDQARVELVAGVFENVIELPRKVLRSGSILWIAKKIDKAYVLDIRQVETIWKDINRVYIDKGVKQGELIIESSIATPIQNMSLRLRDRP